MTTQNPPAPARKRKGPAKLASLVPAAVGPVFSKRGFAGADLAVHWPDIVGPGIARHARPLSLQWPRQGVEPTVAATLMVACSPAFALDLQQMGPVVIERINQRLGWRAVARLTIRQMPVRPQPPPVRPAEVTAADLDAAGRIAAGIAADSLRAAMTRLGATRLARARDRLTRL